MYTPLTQLVAFMCCSVIVAIMIRVSNRAYSDTCGCLLEFQLTLLSSRLHEQTVPMTNITRDIRCFDVVKGFTAVAPNNPHV